LWGGLSPFGKELVKKMNEKGILIDVSHISDKAFYDVISLSKVPVVATHSCCRVFSDNVRNMSDDMIKALAKNGGVLQLNFFPSYLDGRYDRELEERQNLLTPHIDSLRRLYQNDQATLRAEFAKLREKYPYPEPVGVDKLIDHVDHIVKLVGVGYVGIGSDFDGLGVFPKGLEDVSKMPIITYHLLKRGYSEEDISKIVGGNFLRVWEAVEKYSK
jgi:membrane dipeptidase